MGHRNPSISFLTPSNFATTRCLKSVTQLCVVSCHSTSCPRVAILSCLSKTVSDSHRLSTSMCTHARSSPRLKRASRSASFMNTWKPLGMNWNAKKSTMHTLWEDIDYLRCQKKQICLHKVVSLTLNRSAWFTLRWKTRLRRSTVPASSIIAMQISESTLSFLHSTKTDFSLPVLTAESSKMKLRKLVAWALCAENKGCESQMTCQGWLSQLTEA